MIEEWTDEDEAAFIAMKERRKEVINQRNTVAVREVVTSFYYYGIMGSDLAEAMIAKAAVLREALKPFDRSAK